MSSTQHNVFILAGGGGRRMGGVDKGEILIENNRLVDLVVDQMQSQVEQIWIAGPHDYGLGFPIAPDHPKGIKGPVAALYAASHALDFDAFGFFTVPVDGPKIPPDLCTQLFSKSHSSIAMDKERRHPAYAWWRLSELNSVWGVIDFTESISLMRMAKLCRAKEVSWTGSDPTSNYFININSPEDLSEYSILEHRAFNLQHSFEP